MNGLDFQDLPAPLPLPNDGQLRRLAPDLNEVTSYAMLLLLSDRTLIPFFDDVPASTMDSQSVQ